MSDTDDREMGVELGDLDDDLESHEYPASTNELIEAYGDRELGLSRGTETVREALEPAGDETYESAQEVRQMIYNMVGSEAVGREDYSDRGSAPDNVEGESDDQTL
jgi:hypothetical protein